MGQTVLLVEDEALLLEVARADLEDMGYETVCASDGERALEVLQNADPLDALITDIRMPGELDGWHLAMRARELIPGLPVIYVSGYSPDQMRPVAGSVFLKKPYRFGDLQQALAEVGLEPPSLRH